MNKTHAADSSGQPAWIIRRAVPRRPGRIAATGVFMRRTFLGVKNNPFGFIVDCLASPVLMLLIFTFLFGGAIAGSTSEYIQFLLPGAMVLIVAPMTVYSGTTFCQDIAKGVHNRFRTMSVWPPASVLGPIMTDSLRYVVASIVTIGIGLLLGFRPEGGAGGVLMALAYAVFIAFSFSWIFAMMGILVKKPETVSGTSMVMIYPLLFASSIFVDSATMPGWLGEIVDFNPISLAASALRGLMHGTATTADLAWGIGMGTLLIVVFAPLTFYFFRKHNTR
ncbi:ABC transporter permease [Paenibacillus sp. 1011MAR3C5]|uniref:ABC transporter permease n=1 Tax=Paenibacillus sp. 1011MAR3C5 TaxID=1675787 RepID=UPI000E6D017D|nr:ABC transporter permease [Paenibacillus sp. 1011MAR3C5]RJE91097.1 ABC transporter permease [Paenibacillus sp. 1011MAR3C5]